MKAAARIPIIAIAAIDFFSIFLAPNFSYLI
jgi:hypothetical protein